MGKLVLIRHGQTEYNLAKKFCGFTDVSITEVGRESAKKNAEKIQALNITFDAVYTSWLKRAWETLDVVLPLIGQPDLPITKHPFLNERHYGDLQGLKHEDMAAQYGEEQVHTWRRSYAVRPPNGESLADVVYRSSFYLETEVLPQVKAGKNILICCHSNSGRSIVKYLEQISDTDIVGREIPYDEPLVYTL